MIYSLDDVKNRIVGMLSGSAFDVMELALIASGVFIFIDFLVDFFIIHRNRGLIYVLNLNLTLSSLWASFLLVSCFILFGYLFSVYKENVSQRQDGFDGYISNTIEALDVLRYNLYSMRIVLHSSSSDMTSQAVALNSVEDGLSASINLIDSYLEDVK